MKATGKLVLKDRPKPELKKDTDALIKVTGVGICGTDLHILQFPRLTRQGKTLFWDMNLPGKSWRSAAEYLTLRPGTPVLIDPHPGCGVCEACKNGNTDICIPLIAASGEPGHPATIGIFSDGAMTSYAIVPRESLFKVDPKVPSHIRALAEPLACVLNATNKLKAQPGDSVLVLGGPHRIAVHRRAEGQWGLQGHRIRDFRLSQRGCRGPRATLVVDPRKEDLEAIVKRETGGGPNIVVEAVGPLLPQAIKLVGHRGTVLQFGHDETANPTIPVGVMLKKEVQILGAYIGRYSFERAAKVMESGQLPLDKIVSHRLPLSRVHEGIELLRQGKGLKIVLEPEDY